MNYIIPQLQPKKSGNWWVIVLCCLFWVVVVFKGCAGAEELWKITAYCSCFRCCGKSDAITASGKKARYGYVALNWLPFGTKVKIGDLGIFTVMDRGAKSLFGTKQNPIKHIDIYMNSHKEALKFGVKYLPVEILK